MKRLELRNISVADYVDTSEAFIHENGYVVLSSFEKMGEGDPIGNIYMLRPEEAKLLAKTIMETVA